MQVRVHSKPVLEAIPGFHPSAKNQETHPSVCSVAILQLPAIEIVCDFVLQMFQLILIVGLVGFNKDTLRSLESTTNHKLSFRSNARDELVQHLGNVLPIRHSLHPHLWIASSTIRHLDSERLHVEESLSSRQIAMSQILRQDFVVVVNGSNPCTLFEDRFQSCKFSKWTNLFVCDHSKINAIVRHTENTVAKLRSVAITQDDHTKVWKNLTQGCNLLLKDVKDTITSRSQSSVPRSANVKALMPIQSKNVLALKLMRDGWSDLNTSREIHWLWWWYWSWSRIGWRCWWSGSNQWVWLCDSNCCETATPNATHWDWFRIFNFWIGCQDYCLSSFRIFSLRTFLIESFEKWLVPLRGIATTNLIKTTLDLPSSTENRSRSSWPSLMHKQLDQILQVLQQSKTTRSEPSLPVSSTSRFTADPIKGLVKIPGQDPVLAQRWSRLARASRSPHQQP